MSELTLDMSDLKTVKMITVRERNAEDLVSQSIYGDDGEIVGQKTDEHYEADRESKKGFSCFEATVLVDDLELRFRSATVEPPLRAGAMTEMFAYIGSSLFTHFFAKK